MDEAAWRQQKFDSTERLLNEEIMLPDQTSHYEWAVIAMFYAAVYLVDRTAARKGKKIPELHSERNKFVPTIKPRLNRHWQVLFKEGYNARYRPTQYNRQDIMDIAFEYRQVKGILGTT